MITRSQLGIVKPIDRLSLNTFSIFPIPKNSYDALKDSQWRTAMYDEYNALVKNGTWILVPRPTSVNMIRSIWLFKHKFHAEGTLSRYKAHLVVNGSSQQLGVDFDEIFIPVIKPTTIRTTVYMHQLPSFVDSWYPHHVSLLQRSLYGLKQAPRAWFQQFVGYATRAGFYHSHFDSSLFIYRQGSQFAYLFIYMDDIILTASSPVLLQQIINSLHNEFDMTNLGDLNYFLGIYATRSLTSLFLSQKKYALQLLERAHMVNCNPSWHQLIQSLNWVWKVFLFRILLYIVVLQGAALCCTQTYLLIRSRDYGLWSPVVRFRYYFPGDNLLSWSSKRQHILSRSSAKAEYRSVANVVAQTAWLRNLLRELHSPLSIATLVYCDNISAVYMFANPVQHQRTKHIEINIHFVRDMVTDGEVRVLHVPSRYQYADIFTKGQPSVLFEDF
ncbi:ribonuclease H-like domain-containing protein [Tanacetum coccineum]